MAGVSRGQAAQIVESELGGSALSIIGDATLQVGLDRATGSDGTVDWRLACAEVCAVMRRRTLATGAVTRWDDDGVSVTRTAADWGAAEAEYRALMSSGTAEEGGADWAFLVAR